MEELQYKLNKVDNKVQLLQLYSDGFDQLKTKQRILVYHLFNASVAGRDIAFHQKDKHCVQVRNLFESFMEWVWNHQDQEKFKDTINQLLPVIGLPTLESIETYLYYIWIGNGPFDGYTSAKITLKSTKESVIQLLECCHSKLGWSGNCNRSASSSTTTTTTTYQHIIKEAERFIFDNEYRNILTEKSPNKDWIQESSVNFYSSNMTLKEVQDFTKDPSRDRYQINSNLEKNEVTGEIKPLVWRAGCKELGIEPGLYAKELSNVIHHLELAKKYAESQKQAGSIEMLIKFFKTGEAKDFHDFNVHWVGDNSEVDFILGFIEVYTDPMGLRGEYEGSVYWKHNKLSQSISQIGDFVKYFEDRMPWDNKYKKQDVKPLPLSVVQVVGGVGGMGPHCILGVNLPNEDKIREEYGSKSIVLQNIAQAADMASGGDLSNEFCWDQEEIALQKRYGTLSDNIATALHEALGHASGKCVVADPQAALPGYYSTLEEARADLVALYHIWDPKLLELGIVENELVCKALFQQEITNALLLQLRKVDSDRLEEDHMKNRQLIANFVYKNSKAVERRERDGKTFFVVVDYKEMHRQCGILLAEIMRIKAEGDMEAASRLVDTYGLYVDIELRDQVKERVKKLGIATYSAYTMPTLEPVYGIDGKNDIVDVTISYGKDFRKQMLSLSL